MANKLNKRFCDTVSKPGWYGDGLGLALVVQPASDGGVRKSWVQRLTIEGKRRDMGLGPYPSIGLAKAREDAIDRYQTVRRGGDPRTVRGVEAGRRGRVPSFKVIADQVIADRTAGKAEATREQWQSQFDRFVYGKLGPMAIDAINAADVLEVLRRTSEQSPSVVSMLRQRISTVFKVAVVLEHRKDDPAPSLSLVLPNNEHRKQHHKALPYADIGEALRKLSEHDTYPTRILAFRFAAHTAARRDEVRFATWVEIDMTARVWTIPADRTKGGKEHRVPLTDEAIAILNEARRVSAGWSDAGLVFPSPKGKAMPNTALSTLAKECGIDATQHGFRSSFRSWCGDTGQPRELAEAALAHSFGDATERAYARSDLLERRRPIMAAWSSYIAP